MSSTGGKRKLTTILAADVVGYSRLVAADDEAAIRRLRQLRELILDIVARHDGRFFGEAGDGLMAEFPSAVEAVRCSLEIQDEVAARNVDEDAERAMFFRIGINVGETIIEGDNLYGDGVNIAARLQEVAEPGGIVLSAAAYDQIKNKVTVEMEPLGRRALKNIPEPVTVFRARVAPAKARPAETAPAGTLNGWKRRAALAAIALLAVIAAFVGWDALVVPGSRLEAFRAQAAQPLPLQPSIVVMPFLNASDDEAQEYFCMGIAEDILTSLTKVSGLFVVGRESAMSFKGKAVQAKQVGRELGVRYVLQGSVRRAENRVRISTYLVDAATEQTIWASRYDRELGDIFAVQDDIAGKIVQSLSVGFQPGERENVRQQLAMAPKLDAYDLVLQGRRKMIPPTLDGLNEAEGLFKKAIEADSGFAGAYAGLSRVYSLKVSQGFTRTNVDQAIRDAEETARTGLRKDSRSSAALSALAFAVLLQGRQDEAVQYAMQAYDAQPGDAFAAATLGLMLVFSDNPRAAYFPIQRAIERERVSEFQARVQFFKMFAAYEAGDFRGADEAYKAHIKANGQCFSNCLAYAAATKLRLAAAADPSAVQNGFTVEATSAAQTLSDKYPNYRERLGSWLKLYKNQDKVAGFQRDLEKVYALVPSQAK